MTRPARYLVFARRTLTPQLGLAKLTSHLPETTRADGSPSSTVHGMHLKGQRTTTGESKLHDYLRIKSEDGNDESRDTALGAPCNRHVKRLNSLDKQTVYGCLLHRRSPSSVAIWADSCLIRRPGRETSNAIQLETISLTMLAAVKPLLLTRPCSFFAFPGCSDKIHSHRPSCRPAAT